ncbi:MAG TPA: hypothetical protein PLU53_12025 [Bacteroidia bacterium]|nr:hypothetical protein [Bacteroidia bacterium]
MQKTTFKRIAFSLLLITLCPTAKGAFPDSSLSTQASILVIPYKPAMHLSDADFDIAEESEMDQGEIRSRFRAGLVRSLNKQFTEIYDIRLPEQDFVEQDMRDMDLIYHSLAFEQDIIYPVQFPQKDSSLIKKKLFPKSDGKNYKPIDKNYMNVVVRDPALLPEMAKKYNNDYFIFLNEIDIKTHFDDCINLALKIYQREIKVHYTVFDKNGKQVYGDAAVVQFPSNENRVEEIAKQNFPAISDYVLESMKHLHQENK